MYVMEQVRCTNCGSSAIIKENDSDFARCESCGSLFSVKKASDFAKVEIDRAKDIKIWREYMHKQLSIQEASVKKRDYDGVKVFATKILSVLPDDFTAAYYSALSDFVQNNDTEYMAFLKNANVAIATTEELEEVCQKVVFYAQPKYRDSLYAFLRRANPTNPTRYDSALRTSIDHYVEKKSYTQDSERDVFICHRTAQPDQDIADAVCTRLEESGFRCWIAPRNILAGSQNYERDIERGVNSCRLFLFISSYKSIYSDDCEIELKHAVLSDKVLYSFRIDDTPYDGAFKKFLSGVQWTDATDDPYSHIERLVIDIKSLLARDAAEKAELDRQRLEARERERIEAENRRRALDERAERHEQMSLTAPVHTSHVSSKLKRIRLELLDGEFDKASEIIDEVLDIAPDNSEAWWLFMLADLQVANNDALIVSGIDYQSNRGYRNARRFQTPESKAEIDKIDEAFNSSILKMVSTVLDRGEELLSRGDYDQLAKELKKCDHIFANPASAVFTRFNDLASRYYWLKLWVKYGESPSECEQDIRRESEYSNAYRYGTSYQRARYDAVCSQIASNSRAFLVTHAVDQRNNAMLLDYLVDNKGIIPEQTYREFSSLLYFRKMLNSMNVTEDTLRRSTKRIDTNEYFMLAKEMATPEMLVKYKDLEDAIERNIKAAKGNSGSYHSMTANAQTKDAKQSSNQGKEAVKSPETSSGAKVLYVLLALCVTVPTLIFSILAIADSSADFVIASCVGAIINAVLMLFFCKVVRSHRALMFPAVINIFCLLLNAVSLVLSNSTLLTGLFVVATVLTLLAFIISFKKNKVQ